MHEAFDLVELVDGRRLLGGLCPVIQPVVQIAQQPDMMELAGQIRLLIADFDCRYEPVSDHERATVRGQCGTDSL